jgi:AraC-like ligand binding domain
LNPYNKFLWGGKKPFSISILPATGFSDHSFSKHFHSHYVIELVINGADEFYCNRKNWIATKNQFVFIFAAYLSGQQGYLPKFTALIKVNIVQFLLHE